MRINTVAGNWKMNLTQTEANDLSEKIKSIASSESIKSRLILIPSFTYLQGVQKAAKDSNIELGAQDVSANEKGAYTGEISSEMLESIGVKYCLLGHSERRQYHKESNDLLASKLEMLLNRQLTAIFCVGESLQEREEGKLFEVIKNQLEPVLNLTTSQFDKVIIAYEPVWAIGTGKTANSEQAQEMHAFIREQIKDSLGDKVANETTILYGGSCKASNAKELFSSPDVDGGLIGGASLNAREFIDIAKSFS